MIYLMNTYIINNNEEFAQYYHILKEDASLNTVPNRYVVGFDIEFVSKDNFPKFKDQPHNQILCFIQIATKNVCFVVNIFKFDHLHERLLNIIISDSWIKFGVGIENDLTIISNTFNLGHCSGGIELVNIALMANISSPNLERLYNMVNGACIKKANSICDWSLISDDIFGQSSFSNKDELIYAAKDAIISYKLGIEMFKPLIDVLEEKNKKLLDSTNIGINFMNFTYNEMITDIQDQELNYIGKLNEIAQKHNINIPEYSDSKNNSIFVVECTFVDNKTIGKTTSKKAAKQLAAKKMYELVKTII